MAFDATIKEYLREIDEASLLTKEQEQVITKMLYFFWDIGFDIGHSSRSVYACIRMAKENIDSATAMMESRYIYGDKETFIEYQKRINNPWVRNDEVIPLNAVSQKHPLLRPLRSFLSTQLPWHPEIPRR